jgi:hypothetical protein
VVYDEARDVAMQFIGPCDGLVRDLVLENGRMRTKRDRLVKCYVREWLDKALRDMAEKKGVTRSSLVEAILEKRFRELRPS